MTTIAAETARTDWARCSACGRPYQPYMRRKDVQRYCSAKCRTKHWHASHPTIGPRQTDLFGLKEGRRRAGKAEAILTRLRQGPATSLDLVAVGGIRYGARVAELRKLGHRIETEHHSEFAVYRLLEGPCRF